MNFDLITAVQGARRELGENSEILLRPNGKAGVIVRITVTHEGMRHNSQFETNPDYLDNTQAGTLNRQWNEAIESIKELLKN